MASRFFAVGAVVPGDRLGVGALATQSRADPSHRRRGLDLLASGLSARAALGALVVPDEARDDRQLGVMAATAGRPATFTGRGCSPWAGSRCGSDFAVQGNCLVGPRVLDCMAEAFQNAESSSCLAERLLAALVAGERAGGDRRGRQSACLLVVGPTLGTDSALDLRVDDHPDPVAELDRLVGLSRLYRGLPEPDSVLPLTDDLAAEISRRLRECWVIGVDR